MYWLSVAQIILGLLIYQAAQKAVPKTMSPFGFVAIAYAVGCVICIALALVLRGDSTPPDASNAPIARTSVFMILCAIGVGIGATLIEVGYFFGYRSGWAISELPVVVMVATSLCLAAVGPLLFRESLTLPKSLGLLLCGGGLFLLLRK